MSKQLFDMHLRAMRRDRAYRMGVETFLYDRIFTDIIDRLSLIRRRFGTALLIGCPDADWRQRLEAAATRIEAMDPGPLFAQAADGDCIVEDAASLPPERYDLCVAIGTLDSVNDLPAALRKIEGSLRPDALFIGAASGGETLPLLRQSMRAADRESGAASAHVHPRIGAADFGALLSAAGFAMPVVDVDRVPVAYEGLFDLVRDLRAMGTTNILCARSRSPLSRRAAEAAAAEFASAGSEGRPVETFEIIHFAAWKPAPGGHE